MTEALQILKVVYEGNKEFIDSSIVEGAVNFLQTHEHIEDIYQILFNPFIEASSALEVYLENCKDDSDLAPFIIETWIRVLSESHPFGEIVSLLRSDESQYPIPDQEVHP